MTQRARRNKDVPHDPINDDIVIVEEKIKEYGRHYDPDFRYMCLSDITKICAKYNKNVIFPPSFQQTLATYLIQTMEDCAGDVSIHALKLLPTYLPRFTTDPIELLSPMLISIENMVLSESLCIQPKTSTNDDGSTRTCNHPLHIVAFQQIMYYLVFKRKCANDPKLLQNIVEFLQRCSITLNTDTKMGTDSQNTTVVRNPQIQLKTTIPTLIATIASTIGLKSACFSTFLNQTLFSSLITGFYKSLDHIVHEPLSATTAKSFGALLSLLNPTQSRVPSSTASPQTATTLSSSPTAIFNDILEQFFIKFSATMSTNQPISTQLEDDYRYHSLSLHQRLFITALSTIPHHVDEKALSPHLPSLITMLIGVLPLPLLLNKTFNVQYHTGMDNSDDKIPYITINSHKIAVMNQQLSLLSTVDCCLVNTVLYALQKIVNIYFNQINTASIPFHQSNIDVIMNDDTTIDKLVSDALPQDDEHNTPNHPAFAQPLPPPIIFFLQVVLTNCLVCDPMFLYNSDGTIENYEKLNTQNLTEIISSAEAITSTKFTQTTTALAATFDPDFDDDFADNSDMTDQTTTNPGIGYDPDFDDEFCNPCDDFGSSHFAVELDDYDDFSYQPAVLTSTNIISDLHVRETPKIKQFNAQILQKLVGDNSADIRSTALNIIVQFTTTTLMTIKLYNDRNNNQITDNTPLSVICINLPVWMEYITYNLHEHDFGLLQQYLSSLPLLTSVVNYIHNELTQSLYNGNVINNNLLSANYLDISSYFVYYMKLSMKNCAITANNHQNSHNMSQIDHIHNVLSYYGYIDDITLNTPNFDSVDTSTNLLNNFPLVNKLLGASVSPFQSFFAQYDISTDFVAYKNNPTITHPIFTHIGITGITYTPKMYLTILNNVLLKYTNRCVILLHTIFSSFNLAHISYYTSTTSCHPGAVDNQLLLALTGANISEKDLTSLLFVVIKTTMLLIHTMNDLRDEKTDIAYFNDKRFTTPYLLTHNSDEIVVQFHTIYQHFICSVINIIIMYLALSTPPHNVILTTNNLKVQGFLTKLWAFLCFLIKNVNISILLKLNKYASYYDQSRSVLSVLLTTTFHQFTSKHTILPNLHYIAQCFFALLYITCLTAAHVTNDEFSTILSTTQHIGTTLLSCFHGDDKIDNKQTLLQQQQFCVSILRQLLTTLPKHTFSSLSKLMVPQTPPQSIPTYLSCFIFVAISQSLHIFERCKTTFLFAQQPQQHGLSGLLQTDIDDDHQNEDDTISLVHRTLSSNTQKPSRIVRKHMRGEGERPGFWFPSWTYGLPGIYFKNKSKYQHLLPNNDSDGDDAEFHDIIELKNDDGMNDDVNVTDEIDVTISQCINPLQYCIDLITLISAVSTSIDHKIIQLALLTAKIQDPQVFAAFFQVLTTILAVSDAPTDPHTQLTLYFNPYTFTQIKNSVLVALIYITLPSPTSLGSGDFSTFCRALHHFTVTNEIAVRPNSPNSSDNAENFMGMNDLPTHNFYTTEEKLIIEYKNNISAYITSIINDMPSLYAQLVQSSTLFCSYSSILKLTRLSDVTTDVITNILVVLVNNIHNYIILKQSLEKISDQPPVTTLKPHQLATKSNRNKSMDMEDELVPVITTSTTTITYRAMLPYILSIIYNITQLIEINVKMTSPRSNCRFYPFDQLLKVLSSLSFFIEPTLQVRNLAISPSNCSTLLSPIDFTQVSPVTNWTKFTPKYAKSALSTLPTADIGTVTAHLTTHYLTTLLSLCFSSTTGLLNDFESRGLIAPTVTMDTGVIDQIQNLSEGTLGVFATNNSVITLLKEPHQILSHTLTNLLVQTQQFGVNLQSYQQVALFLLNVSPLFVQSKTTNQSDFYQNLVFHTLESLNTVFNNIMLRKTPNSVAELFTVLPIELQSTHLSQMIISPTMQLDWHVVLFLLFSIFSLIPQSVYPTLFSGISQTVSPVDLMIKVTSTAFTYLSSSMSGAIVQGNIVGDILAQITQIPQPTSSEREGQHPNTIATTLIDTAQQQLFRAQHGFLQCLSNMISLFLFTPQCGNVSFCDYVIKQITTLSRTVNAGNAQRATRLAQRSAATASGNPEPVWGSEQITQELSSMHNLFYQLYIYSLVNTLTTYSELHTLTFIGGEGTQEYYSRNSYFTTPFYNTMVKPLRFTPPSPPEISGQKVQLPLILHLIDSVVQNTSSPTFDASSMSQLGLHSSSLNTDHIALQLQAYDALITNILYLISPYMFTFWYAYLVNAAPAENDVKMKIFYYITFIVLRGLGNISQTFNTIILYINQNILPRTRQSQSHAVQSPHSCITERYLTLINAIIQPVFQALSSLKRNELSLTPDNVLYKLMCKNELTLYITKLVKLQALSSSYNNILSLYEYYQSDNLSVLHTAAQTNITTVHSTDINVAQSSLDSYEYYSIHHSVRNTLSSLFNIVNMGKHLNEMFYYHNNNYSFIFHSKKVHIAPCVHLYSLPAIIVTDLYEGKGHMSYKITPTMSSYTNYSTSHIFATHTNLVIDSSSISSSTPKTLTSASKKSISHLLQIPSTVYLASISGANQPFQTTTYNIYQPDRDIISTSTSTETYKNNTTQITQIQNSITNIYDYLASTLSTAQKQLPCQHFNHYTDLLREINDGSDISEQFLTLSLYTTLTSMTIPSSSNISSIQSAMTQVSIFQTISRLPLVLTTLLIEMVVRTQLVTKVKQGQVNKYFDDGLFIRQSALRLFQQLLSSNRHYTMSVLLKPTLNAKSQAYNPVVSAFLACVQDFDILHSNDVKRMFFSIFQQLILIEHIPHVNKVASLCLTLDTGCNVYNAHITHAITNNSATTLTQQNHTPQPNINPPPLPFSSLYTPGVESSGSVDSTKSSDGESSSTDDLAALSANLNAASGTSVTLFKPMLHDDTIPQFTLFNTFSHLISLKLRSYLIAIFRLDTHTHQLAAMVQLLYYLYNIPYVDYAFRYTLTDGWYYRAPQQKSADKLTTDNVNITRLLDQTVFCTAKTLQVLEIIILGDKL